ncbi:MAG: phospho-sugar mutase, partial [Myxococcota bacterium]
MRAKPTLLDRAHAWLSEDPDSDTQEELRAALDTPNAERNKKLETWFGSSLSFGTAGLRGPLGPGPNRMNELVVARTSAGICAWLRARVQSAPERGICIGYDARRKSLQFAQAAAEIFAAQGFVAHIFESTVPTPLLAFAVTELDASAGIMITASHNPPNYNGCKVFWENGAQIIPPNDTGIASEIKNIGAYTTIDRAVYKEALRQGRVRHVGPEMRRRYLEGIARATPHAPRTIRIVYTALHGVGDRLAREAMQKAGFTQVTTVPDQAEPDGSFPTLELPNPEEPSALRKVLALAEVCGADLALANDPDADRLAVACKDETRFRILNGNEIGCLLAHHLLRSKKNSRSTKGPCILSSIVSSPW